MPSANDSIVSGEPKGDRGADVLWLGLIGAVVVSAAASINWVIGSGSHGVDSNRGPGIEAAPGGPRPDAPRSR